MTERQEDIPVSDILSRNTMTEAGLGFRILSLFFPARCLLCGEVSPSGNYLCDDCRDKVTEKSLRSFNLKFGRSARFLHVHSPEIYSGKYRDAIISFKFSGNKYYADELARFIYDSLGEGFFLDFDLLTFVPMTDAGKRKRKYNQAELIAKRLSRLTGIKCMKLIEKTKENRAQHKLSAADRVQNVKGVYSLSTDIKGQKILLVDDIITTGSTLSECAIQLFKGFAAEVTGVCAANAK